MSLFEMLSEHKQIKNYRLNKYKPLYIYYVNSTDLLFPLLPINRNSDISYCWKSTVCF